ncbi:SMI1/KNR4 family protein [Sorangium sp. So ce1151]|uniref:SMI1/KNR4 family protein n=1 Tax=Sorangium sp. So ce1151 TaxID=3133332 RepID=UPI003F5F0A0B
MNERDFPDFTLERPVTVTSSDSDIQEAEAALGVPLPPSFCDFARRFGYGRIFNLMILFIPMGNHCDSITVRGPSLVRFFHEEIDNKYFEYDPDGSPELARRLIPFGISEDGHFFAWDPAEPTGGGELMIYAIGSKMLAVRRAGRNLYELLHGITDARVKQILGPGYDPDEELLFEPLDKQ